MNPPEKSVPLLHVENLCKFFPIHRQKLHAVDHVSFCLQAGESIGLVGESGCGKSTLIRLITRLLAPTAGEITFAGQSLNQIPLDQFPQHPLRAKIQMVFQDATDSLNPRFTAYDTIADPIKRLDRGRDPKALEQQVKEIAKLVGLSSELLGCYPHQLSGGQKARIGIARSIALHPSLLILDEPTSALDVSVQAVILRLLADLRQQLGMSYLFVSHDLNVVRLLCDRILVMYLGKIVEAGPVESVFQNPQHPYTAALLSAIPSFEAIPHPIPLNGEPRSPVNPNPHTCRLYGRCPQERERCTIEMPRLQEVTADHRVACHFPVGHLD